MKTDADHRAALQEVSAPVAQDPALDTPEADRLDALVTLVQAHEARHFPIGPPTPIEAIKFRMEQQGLTPKDLQPMIGGLNRVYEVLAGRRPLTLAMVRRLHNQLGIPAESLIGT